MSLFDAIDSIIGQSKDVATNVADQTASKIDSMTPYDANASSAAEESGITASSIVDTAEDIVGNATDAVATTTADPAAALENVSLDQTATELGIFAFAWLLFAFLAQSSAFKRLSEKELPSIITYALAAACLFVVFYGFIAFFAQIPVYVYAAALKAVVAFALLLPVLVIIAVVGEKVLTIASHARR